MVLLTQGAGVCFSKDDTIRLDVKVEGQEKRLEPEDEMAIILERVKKGDLPTIQFEFDSEKLKPSSAPTLDAIADLMLRNPKMKLLVHAHTCTIGTKEYNLDLSERRAKSVKTYLTKKGVPPPSIRFRGKGFSEPIADNKTIEGRRLNRRVEFQLLRRWWSSIY